eukprot:14110-Heterococcus_DN1.PRE.1
MTASKACAYARCAHVLINTCESNASLAAQTTALQRRLQFKQASAQQLETIITTIARVTPAVITRSIIICNIRTVSVQQHWHKRCVDNQLNYYQKLCDERADKLFARVSTVANDDRDAAGLDEPSSSCASSAAAIRVWNNQTWSSGSSAPSRKTQALESGTGLCIKRIPDEH